MEFWERMQIVAEGDWCAFCFNRNVKFDHESSLPGLIDCVSLNLYCLPVQKDEDDSRICTKMNKHTQTQSFPRTSSRFLLSADVEQHHVTRLFWLLFTSRLSSAVRPHLCGLVGVVRQAANDIRGFTLWHGKDKSKCASGMRKAERGGEWGEIKWKITRTMQAGTQVLFGPMQEDFDNRSKFFKWFFFVSTKHNVFLFYFCRRHSKTEKLSSIPHRKKHTKYCNKYSDEVFEY